VSDPFESRWSGIGVGGSLAADFVNTLDWRLRKVPREGLHAYADLVRWAWSAEVVTGSEARLLLKWAELHPRAAARELARAVELRESIALLFAAIRDRTRLPSAALAVLDAASRAGALDRSLNPVGRFAEWGRAPGASPPQRPAWAVADDAARLITSPERERLSQCRDDECGWFFLDTSRNRSRRWCSMKGCGNRNKARTFYRRARRPAKRS
jgi:predicted RNA-binding Zn ribbon-like protein